MAVGIGLVPALQSNAQVVIKSGDGRIVKRLSNSVSTYGARALSYTRNGRVSPLPMRLIRGVHPVLRVRVNGGRNLDVLLDTGANRTFVPPGIFGERRGQKFIRVQTLCFENDTCFEGPMVSVTPTNYSQKRRGYYNGLLGVDLLRHTGLTIDYKNRRVFLGHDAGVAAGEAAIRTRFYMDGKTWRPHAKMTMGTVDFPGTLLDTGSSFTRLTPTMMSKLDRVPATAYRELAFSAHGTRGSEILYLGNVCIDNTACVPGILGQRGNWSAIGATFFRNFLTTFDFQNLRLTLRPYGASWIPPMSAMQRLGLQLDILDAANIVFVEVGSPAALADIRKGAELHQINGRSIQELGYLGAHEILEDADLSSFDISIRNAKGKARTVRLTARRRETPSR
ncbi:MAG: hypothetical protein HN478_18430 [Rhodospirillaceae bacterium]|nr:hypothetical protein [Rhodospirillaceae bacterium]MBT4486178.1 hypothetical protein [Rhodospirillaceae bacterium]MBT5193228.1 hypothetical protein [Rhodospirillaceae bacterium]MBT6429243.1 hypothetical protein [Rhodospirillaceae bacterium]MBT7759440.1 hypothetical protein [Rhodospirillaceae bacterium]